MADTVKWLHKRVTDHIDTHVWPKAPAAPKIPAPPDPPPLPGLPSPPAIGSVLAGPGLGGAVAGGPSPATPATPTPVAGTSYSDQVAQGIACLACTRGHLATAQRALEEAARAQAAGDAAAARRQWAVAAAELDAMVELDWAPEKLAATPAEERAIVEAIRPCVESVRRQLPTPPDVAAAHGLAVESRRFALSTRFTDRDQAEIEARLRAIDLHGNYAERVGLPGDATAAARALREARHVLDRAQVDGSVYRPETWAAVITYTEAAAVAATPVLEPEVAGAAAAECRRCTDDFYGRFLTLMRARRATGPVGP